jgi:hypothetical protein
MANGYFYPQADLSLNMADGYLSRVFLTMIWLTDILYMKD